MMKKFKVNSFTAIILAFSLILFLFLAVSDEKIEVYEHVTIEKGDTLWSLAETYRGKMATDDWISFVQKENGLQDEMVVYGQVLVVPVEKNSRYIAQLNSEQSSQQQLVKVARNNESN